MVADWMVDAIETLFMGRDSWSPPAMRGAWVWESSLANHLHAEALLEDMRRRGGPRTPREHSEREWLLQALDRDVVEANRAAWARHRATTPTPRPRAKRRTLADYYADVLSAPPQGAAA